MDPDADPLPDVYAPKDKSLDANSDATRALADAVGFTRLCCPLFDQSAIPSREPAIYEKSSALIVVAQTGLYPAQPEGAPRSPFVASLLLANGFGRPLAFYESTPVGEAQCVAPGVRPLSTTFALQSDMRRGILS